MRFPFLDGVVAEDDVLRPASALLHPAGEIGDDVRHNVFGEGVILDLSGAGEKAEARVRFREAGEKTLLLSWAPLEKL